jgi:hypothetical protein
VGDLTACLVSNRVGLGGARSACVFYTENSTLQAVFTGQLPRISKISSKRAYKIGPPRAPEDRQKGLTLTLTKHALSCLEAG